jgi:hypothetical protein
MIYAALSTMALDAPARSLRSRGSSPTRDRDARPWTDRDRPPTLGSMNTPRTSARHVDAGSTTRVRRSLRVAAAALLAVLLSLAAAQEATTGAAEAAADTFTVNVYYFWGDGCPVCVQQRAFLDWLVERYPEVQVHAFEVWRDLDNRPRLQALSDAFTRPVHAVPVTFIGEDSWIGFNQVASVQMTASVEASRTYHAPDALDRLPPEVRAALFPEPPPAP